MGQFAGAWLLTVALIPVGLALAALLSRWRPPRTSLLEVGLVLTTLPWVLMILQSASPPPGSRMAYLVPFSDLWVEFTTYSWANLAVQVGGNLGVLLGFGALAPLRFEFFTSISRIFLCGAGISLSLEVLQHIVAAGRV